MPRSDRFLVTVSPPTLDRTEFNALDRALHAPHAPFQRDWLLAAFGTGLELRMLRPPLSGFVAFQPGRLCWRPVLGVDRAIMVHDMRVARHGPMRLATQHLWDAVEEFARYYGYCAITALTGSEGGMIAPDLVPRRDWVELDRGPGNTRLIGKVLSGPMALPHMPDDWWSRATQCGPGLVVQTTGESAPLAARADRLERRLRRLGIPVRQDILRDPEAVHRRAVSPGAQFSVLLDGARLGGAELSEDQILRCIQQVLGAHAPA